MDVVILEFKSFLINLFSFIVILLNTFYLIFFNVDQMEKAKTKKMGIGMNMRKGTNMGLIVMAKAMFTMGMSE